MSNDTKKKVRKQRKASRKHLIASAQNQWKQDAEQLAFDKATLGYKDLPWDAFLDLNIDDDLFDTPTQSKILSLQNQYKNLIKQKEIIWAEESVVREFNQTHAIVHVDQTYILTEKINALGAQDFSLESRQSFRTFYEDETIECIDGVERSKADIWLKSPKRRKYKGVIFDPRKTNGETEYYNIWKGFTRQPIKGDCTKYWAHVKENICNNNEELYQYLRKWLACVFQHPDQVHTAIALRGTQGVGKNSFVEPLGVLLGSHYAPLSSISELISNFNYHLKNAVLIHANEALWGGNKKDIGTVKAMITEQTCLIEGKGKDRIVVRNFKHIIISSNEDWPIYLDPDDRRVLVLQVSEKRKEDHAYFKSIQDELENGGYEALLHDLLNEDLDGFNPRKLPPSADSFSIKIRSAESSYRYLYEVLNCGGFSVGKNEEGESPVWQSIIPKASVYEDYVSWCKNSSESAQSKELFGRAVKKLIASVEDTRPAKGIRIRCYKFTSLKQSREDFCKLFKEECRRIFDDFNDVVHEVVQDPIEHELPF